MVSQIYVVFVVMLVASAVTVEAGKSSEDEMEVVKSCVSLANPEVAMCSSMIEKMGKEKRDKCNIKEGEITCESAKCILKEDGLDGDDIDLEKATENLDDFVKKHEGLKDMGDRIKKYCFEERQFELYPPEDCPAASLILCTYMNSVITSSELSDWKDTDQCKKFAEDAQTCKKALDSM